MLHTTRPCRVQVVRPVARTRRSCATAACTFTGIRGERSAARRPVPADVRRCGEQKNGGGGSRFSSEVAQDTGGGPPLAPARKPEGGTPQNEERTQWPRKRTDRKST